MKIKKARIIIFEGIDGSGKDTLVNLFLKSTNWKHWVINRGPASYVVYGRLYGRNLNYDDYYRFDAILTSLGAARIYLEANKKEIVKRNLEKADNDIDFKDIDKILFNYDYFLFKSIMPTIRIDTSKLKPKECIKIIKRFVENG